MKVIFVGNKKSAFTHTNIYREKALTELDHDVIFFEGRDFILPGRLRDRFPILHNWDFQRLNQRLVSLVRRERPDLCLVIGDRLPLPTVTTLEQIRTIGSLRALWVTDQPGNPGFSRLLQTAGHYDAVFCAGTEAIDIFKRKGIEILHWLPFGCDPDYHRKVAATPDLPREYKKDVVFVGSFYPNRWQILKELHHFDLGIWGPYWDISPNSYSSRMYIKSGRIDVSEWVKIYSAAKIVLVIHYQDDATICHQASPKIYEALACGCFVLVDRQEDVFSLFEDEKHLVGFTDTDDLHRKIAYYLSHPDERQEIANNGREEVLTKHTYRHRLHKIIEVLT